MDVNIGFIGFAVLIAAVVVGVLIWYFYPTPPNDDDICKSYWKYRNGSIKYWSTPGEFVCKDTIKPGFCILPFSRAKQECDAMEECIGFMTKENSDTAELIPKMPYNYGAPTDIVFYQKK